MDTMRWARNVLLIGLQLALPLAVSAAWAAATPEQQCKAAKMKAIGRYYVCRMQVEARAVATGNLPDFSKCEQSAQRKFAALEATFAGEPNCSMQGFYGVGSSTMMTRRDAGDMACRLRDEGRAGRIERPGSIVLVDFQLDANPILSLRSDQTLSPYPVHARCFYVSRAPEVPACVGSAEFLVAVPAHGDVSWPASQGATAIPPVPASIPYGYLVCVELDDADVPFLGNRLIVSVSDDYRCAQDGFPIEGVGFESDTIFDFDLCLGSQPSAACPTGADYEPCPFAWDHSLKPEMEGCWSTVSSSFNFHCQ